MNTKVRFCAHGRVQGVGFRNFVKKAAMANGLFGWVKNNSDGSVTSEVQGAESLIKNFLTKVKKGSFFSRVDELEIEMQEEIEQPAFDSFEIRF